MENRDRDKVSRGSEPSSSEDLNRDDSQRQGQFESGSNADFGQNIERSESWKDEPSRRSGSESSDIETDRSSSRNSGMGSSETEH